MRVTLHAAERFLQRVFKMAEYSHEDLMRAIQLLERETSTILFNSYRKNVILPSFNDYVAVTKEHTVLTIIDKSRRKGY